MKCSINKYVNGKYVATYRTSLDAAKSVDTTMKGAITDCCKHIKDEYKGAKWYYSNDETQPDKTKIIQSN